MTSRSTAPDPWAAALRLLTRRDRSERELGEALRRRGCDPEDVAKVVQRCRDLGYVDDSRYAEQTARSLMSSGRAVGRRLQQELKKRGLDEKDTLHGVDAALSEADPAEVLERLAQRRFPDFSWRAAEDKERRRIVNFFLRRGFSLEQVLTFLKDER